MILIKDGQLGHIALTMKMINNHLILKDTQGLIRYHAAQKFQCKCSSESATSANELAFQVFVQWLLITISFSKARGVLGLQYLIRPFWLEGTMSYFLGLPCG